MKPAAHLLALAGLALGAGCNRSPDTPAPVVPVVSADGVKRYPLKGVIVDVLPEQSALMVRHEEIPGYMVAMTMQFKVDTPTLRAARKGQAITGVLVDRPNEFGLENVKPIP